MLLQSHSRLLAPSTNVLRGGCQLFGRQTAATKSNLAKNGKVLLLPKPAILITKVRCRFFHSFHTFADLPSTPPSAPLTYRIVHKVRSRNLQASIHNSIQPTVLSADVANCLNHVWPGGLLSLTSLGTRPHRPFLAPVINRIGLNRITQ